VATLVAIIAKKAVVAPVTESGAVGVWVDYRDSHAIIFVGAFDRNVGSVSVKVFHI
jgi:hypothetical protein